MLRMTNTKRGEYSAKREMRRKETDLMKWAGELGNPTGFIETCLKLLIALIMSLSFSLKSEKDL